MKVKKCRVNEDEPVGMAFTTTTKPGFIQMSIGQDMGNPILKEVFAIEPVHAGEILTEVKNNEKPV